MSVQIDKKGSRKGFLRQSLALPVPDTFSFSCACCGCHYGGAYGESATVESTGSWCTTPLLFQLTLQTSFITPQPDLSYASTALPPPAGRLSSTPILQNILCPNLPAPFPRPPIPDPARIHPLLPLRCPLGLQQKDPPRPWSLLRQRQNRRTRHKRAKITRRYPETTHRRTDPRRSGTWALRLQESSLHRDVACQPRSDTGMD